MLSSFTQNQQQQQSLYIYIVVDKMFKNLSFFKNVTVPIWFMRQAGRYLPEYREIRTQKKNFLDLCFSSDLACDISLQPIKRFNFDAVILFSDILVIPYSLGQNVTFQENKGPVLNPINTVKDIKFFSKKIWLKKLMPSFETIKLIKRKNSKPLIGFTGSPFTLLTYMLEGGTSKDHYITKKKLIENPKEIDKIIELLVEISVFYLEQQVKAGVQILQIFESWASVLDGALFEKYIIEPNRLICSEIKKKFPKIPIIFFPKGSAQYYPEIIERIEMDVISLDLKFPSKVLSLCRKKDIVIQGCLDPVRLVVGGKQLEETTKWILNKFKHNKHIFNLSHGILPQTPIKNVEKVINIVRENEKS